MEDRHTLIPCFNVGASDGIHRQFVAVYDGHSSHRGSEHASRRLHEFIAQQEAVGACQVGVYGADGSVNVCVFGWGGLQTSFIVQQEAVRAG